MKEFNPSSKTLQPDKINTMSEKKDKRVALTMLAITVREILNLANNPATRYSLMPFGESMIEISFSVRMSEPKFAAWVDFRQYVMQQADGKIVISDSPDATQPRLMDEKEIWKTLFINTI
jgi:hypothetical protein